MTAPDTNDALIARCQKRAESFGSVPQRTLYDGERKYAEDVPALIAALTAAQAELERLSAIADTEKATSFKLRQELSDTLAELHRLRAKVKQGDALAAALRNVRRYVLSADMDYPQVDAALAAWEDTPGGDG